MPPTLRYTPPSHKAATFAAFGCGCVVILVAAALYLGVAAVIIHFIRKVW